MPKDTTLPDEAPCRNADGTICKIGQGKGAACYRHGGKKKVKKVESAYKLDRFLLDEIMPDAIEQASSMKDLYEALGISVGAFYYWIENGKQDLEEGKESLQREFYEAVLAHRKKAALEMAGVAMEAARGVKVWEEGKDSYYQRPPDGKLALQIATRFDQFAMPVERKEVQHSGSIKHDRLDALRDALEDDGE